MTPTFMNSKAFDESVANLSSVNDTLPSKVQSTSNEDAVQLNNGGKYLRIMDGDGNYRKVFVPSALTNFTLESTKFPPSGLLRHRRAIAESEDVRLHSSGLCYNFGKEESRHPNMRAICPWNMMTDYDANRQPQEILVAKCRCTSKCLNHNVNARCLEYVYPLKVKVKQDNNWVVVKQYKPVSCYCSF